MCSRPGTPRIALILAALIVLAPNSAVADTVSCPWKLKAFEAEVANASKALAPVSGELLELDRQIDELVRDFNDQDLLTGCSKKFTARLDKLSDTITAHSKRVDQHSDTPDQFHECGAFFDAKIKAEIEKANASGDTNRQLALASINKTIRNTWLAANDYAIGASVAQRKMVRLRQELEILQNACNQSLDF